MCWDASLPESSTFVLPVQRTFGFVFFLVSGGFHILTLTDASEACSSLNVVLGSFVTS